MYDFSSTLIEPTTSEIPNQSQDMTHRQKDFLSRTEFL